MLQHYGKYRGLSRLFLQIVNVLEATVFASYLLIHSRISDGVKVIRYNIHYCNYVQCISEIKGSFNGQKRGNIAACILMLMAVSQK